MSKPKDLCHNCMLFPQAIILAVHRGARTGWSIGVMITRLWVLATTWAYCVESLSKTLNLHCSSPPRWKKKWVPASYHAGKVEQTRLCRRSSVPPQQKNYIVESGLNAKEIEMDTTAESLSFGFDFTFTFFIMYCYLEFKLRYLKNLKLFSMWVK